MKPWIFALAVLLGASAAQASKGSAGVVVSLPEIAGVYGSFWPLEDFSVDARLTLSTADVGGTAHLAVADTGAARHDIVVTAMAGYVHDLLANHWLTYRGARVLGAVGYGYQGGWDVRVLAGVSGQQMAAPQPWSATLTLIAMVGHSF